MNAHTPLTPITRIDGTPDAVDLHVGLTLRTIRKERGWSQGQLAEALKISFQQVQKYERGSNRVSASRLWHMSEALKVPVSEFFAGLPENEERATAASFMPWAVTVQGLRWIGLGRKLDPEQLGKVAEVVEMIVGRR